MLFLASPITLTHMELPLLSDCKSWDLATRRKLVNSGFIQVHELTHHFPDVVIVVPSPRKKFIHTPLKAFDYQHVIPQKLGRFALMLYRSASLMPQWVEI